MSTSSTSPSGVERSPAAEQAIRLLQFLAPFLVLLVALGFFSLTEGAFFTANNLKAVAIQTVIVGLAAIGMTFVIVSAGIDLSVGSVMALSSVVTAWLFKRDVPVGLAALGGMATGATCGLLSGLAITGLRIVPFVATLGMLGIARGTAKWLADNSVIHLGGRSNWVHDFLMARFPEPSWLIVAPGAWMLLLLAVGMGFVLHRSVLGIHTFAIGSNEATARLCGVGVRRTKVGIYALCGMFAGLSGVMIFGRLNLGDPTSAVGAELDVIAAVVIGGASLAGGTGSIAGTIAGAVLMSSLATWCELKGYPNFFQEILIGAIIVLAVTLDRLRHRTAT